MAHELGHAMHSYFANKSQPFATANAPIFVAEVASTFNEALQHKVAQADQRITALTTLIDHIGIAIARRTDTRGDAFTMTIDGMACAKRTDAGRRLQQLVAQLEQDLLKSSHRRLEERPGQLGGFPVVGDDALVDEVECAEVSDRVRPADGVVVPGAGLHERARSALVWSSEFESVDIYGSGRLCGQKRPVRRPTGSYRVSDSPPR